jgi:hypothetical protein
VILPRFHQEAEPEEETQMGDIIMARNTGNPEHPAFAESQAKPIDRYRP